MDERRILQLAQGYYYGFNIVRHIGEWKGYQVYSPGEKGETPMIGLPVFVLVKGEEMRLSTHEEAFAAMRYLYPDEEDEEEEE
ncbi:MAG: hypothetical protein GXZ11_01435 [Tissierellia bacterium]|nr:hypothetical protein [Tissierellia bacterium]